MHGSETGQLGKGGAHVIDRSERHEDEDDDLLLIDSAVDELAEPEPEAALPEPELAPEPDVIPDAPPIAELVELEDTPDAVPDPEPEPDTDNIDDPVRRYLRDISQFKLLKAADEVSIAKRIEAGLLVRATLKEMLDEVPDGVRPALLQALERGKADTLAARFRRSVPEHMVPLLVAADDGWRAHNQLTEANLRLVVSIAKRYMNRGLVLLDVIQEGNIGLQRAVDKFDYKLGFKFSTYATWWIRQAITRAIADQARTIRIPVHMVETMTAVNRAARNLHSSLNREPTDQEIADELNQEGIGPFTAERIREIRKAAQAPVSLETPIGEEEDSHLGDLIEDRNAPSPLDYASMEDLKDRIRGVLEHLSVRERRVLTLRYGLENETLGGRTRTLEEVGAELGVTRERVRQIEAKALRKCRHPEMARHLRHFLD